MVSNFHTKSATEILEVLATEENGLSSIEAARRLKTFGPNILPEIKPDGYVLIFFQQFKSPLIYVLLAAGVIVFLMGQYIDALAIYFVLLFNAAIGAFQEGKAKNTFRALKKLIITEAVVRRDGREITIPSEGLVVGDVIVIRDGDKVPADARLIMARHLQVDESALTGESVVVAKNSEILKSENLPVADQTNMVFKGTYVSTGKGEAIVVATGQNTVIGQISGQLRTIDTEIPLKADLRSLSVVIVLGVVIINLFLFIVGLWRGNSFIDMFTTVVAVSVSLIPEGLPVVMTLVLAAGVWRMSKRQALIKRLQAVEALGQASIIAVDKTGTVTKNELMVSKVFVAGQIYEIGGDGYEPTGAIRLNGQVIDPMTMPDLIKTGKIATFCANASTVYSEEHRIWKVAGDPTEAALLVFGQKVGFHKTLLEKNNPLIGEIPFTADLKYHAVLHQIENGNFFIQVGAPEVVIESARYVWHDGGRREITNKDKQNFWLVVKQMTIEGLRVLALAENHSATEKIAADHLPSTTLVGLFGLSDVIRKEAIVALTQARAAGVKVIMITGDHKDTAKVIAAKVGIFKPGDEIISGYDLATLSDNDLKNRLPKITVFARVTPEHKLRIIELYKSAGQVIAMTGDGVNDALSLVAADLGVAMGKIGTEVAKEASDIVLLDDNFGSIISAIEEGRNIYQTIKKVVLYLFSTSISEVLVIIFAILLGWPLPLLASQIIWLNLVTDSFLVAALALDPKDKNLLTRPFYRPNRWFFDQLMVGRTLLMTGVMTVGSLILFWFYLPVSALANGLNESAMRPAWSIVLTVMVLFQWMNIWNCRSEYRSIFKMPAGENKYLLLSASLVIGLQLMALYLPFFQTFLRTTGLSIFDWLIVALMSLLVIIVEEIRKLVARYEYQSN